MEKYNLNSIDWLYVQQLADEGKTINQVARLLKFSSDIQFRRLLDMNPTGIKTQLMSNGKTRKVKGKWDDKSIH